MSNPEMLERIDEFVEDLDQVESEEDLEELSQETISQAVLSANDWTSETILNQINKNNIVLNPAFQRRDAWDKKRKSKFIESLILGLPVPQLVLAESKDRRGAYIVLDGKQRLLSIRQFAASKNDEVFSQLKLSGIDIRKDLIGKSLDSLKADATLYDDLSSFENQPIRTVVIKNWPNENFLYHVFLRLNTGSVSLSPQELRQALHPGRFVEFVDIESGNSEALKEILNIKKPDFRMRDAELLVRYYSFKNFLGDYSGVLKKFLDDSCKKLNDSWEDVEDKIKEELNQFEKAHKAVVSIFGKKNMYKKWNGTAYETRFNRAIFDVMTFFLSLPDIREPLQADKEKTEAAFKGLCEHDQDFLTSIETTTKSLTATCTRLSKWSEVINSEFGMGIKVPVLVDNRIQ